MRRSPCVCFAALGWIAIGCGSGDDPGSSWTWGSSDAGSEAAQDAIAQPDGAADVTAQPDGADDAASPDADASAEGAAPQPCGCLLGEGPYCAGRAQAEAQAAGCTLDALAGHETDLLKCENDTWDVLETCAQECVYDPSSNQLDDQCALPVCDCFVQVAWCGSGAAKKAVTLGCQIPLLPEHNGDILYCPGGVWSVKQECSLGCVEAPDGTPDYCKDNSEYRLPWTCGQTHSCTNGNHTSSHDGKDEYAYDFGMPVGTTLRAMRPGTVLRVRKVSSPGDACYDGGGSSCANYANTVEVLHADGTVALYMHLSTISATKGAHVERGDAIGKSGNSGWSTGPHLHVQVQQDCGIWWCQSIPFKVAENGNISAGTSVTSENCP